MIFDLPSPSAVVETVHGGAGHGRSSLAHLTTKVGRNVGAPHLTLTAHLGARRGLIDGKVAHSAAELIRHDCVVVVFFSDKIAVKE